ncbi:MAG: CoA transferase, partial [Bacteroidota bacterium]
FYTKDKKPVVIAVGTDRQFKDLCATLGKTSVAQHPSFQTNAARVKNRTALVAALKDGFKAFTRDDLLHQLHEKGVPAGSIRNMQEVFEQQQAQAMVLEEHQDGNLTRCVRTVAFDVAFFSVSDELSKKE